MSQIFPQTGLPGLRTAVQATHREILFGGEGNGVLVPGTLTIDGTKSRDPGNTPITNLRPGLLMGIISASGKVAPSVIGTLRTAYSSGTTMTTLADGSIATEIVRRIGSTGTFNVTGPATAGGTVRTLTVTYSAASTSTGDITITAPAVAQVEQINFNIASTGGNLALRIQKPDGTFATTGTMAWSGTDATYLSNINTALDTATGSAGAIVASAIPATDTDLGIRLTYASASYPTGATRAQVVTFPTSSTTVTYDVVTAAVDGRFVAGSLIGPTDGSQTPRFLIPGGYGISVVDVFGNSQDQPQFGLVNGGLIYTTNIVNVPSDTALLAWVKSTLNTYGTFRFSDSVGVS